MRPKTTALNEQRLRYLYEAACHGSLRAAADELDKNAAVLSRQIGKLEEELRMPVIERHGRGVKLTEAGQLLVAFFRQHIASGDDLIAKLDEIRGLSRGQVDVVVGEGFVSDLLAEPLSVFWKRHPKLTVSLNVAGTNEIIRRVEEDGAQMGLVYNPPSVPRIQSWAAARHPLCAIMSPHHPLAKRRRPKLVDLRSYPVAQMDSAYGVRQLIEIAEFTEKIRLTPTLTTNSMSILKHFAGEGLGIMMLPAFAVSGEIAAGKLVANPIDHPALVTAEAHVITRLGRRLSGAANELLRLLTSLMQTFRKPEPSSRSRG
jgi:DNA-binding transcriptional LysR family regulator